MKKLFALSLMAFYIPAMADTINLGAYADHNECDYNKPCTVSGLQTIEIINKSDQSHRYSYNYSLCVTDQPDICRTIGNDITISPHTTWENAHNTPFVVSFDRWPRHIVTSAVYVSGYQSDQRQGKSDINLH